jgi:hypothetical protein
MPPRGIEVVPMLSSRLPSSSFDPTNHSAPAHIHHRGSRGFPSGPQLYLSSFQDLRTVRAVIHAPTAVKHTPLTIKHKPPAVKHTPPAVQHSRPAATQRRMAVKHFRLAAEQTGPALERTRPVRKHLSPAHELNLLALQQTHPLFKHTAPSSLRTESARARERIRSLQQQLAHSL